MDRKAVLQEAAETSVRKLIGSNGGNMNGKIFDQLEFMADFVEKYGEKQYFLPLKAKKLLCTMLDPDYRIDYTTVKNGEACEVEAKLYWSDSDKPAGCGYVRRQKADILPNNSLSAEERENLLEATCRGLAASRAITDAGIGAQLFGEKDDFKEEAEIDDQKSSLDIKMSSPLPQIKTKEEKRAEKAKTNVKEEIPVIPEVSEPSLFDLFEEPAKETPTQEASNADDKALSEAMNAIADIGALKGNTLGDIYRSQPRNLIQLINNNSAVSEAARIIVMSDPALASRLAR